MIAKFDIPRFLQEHNKRVSRLSKAQTEGLTFLLRKLADDPRVPHVVWTAYILATAKWETGHTYQPIAEWPGNDPEFRRYDPGVHPHAIKMGNTRPGDGKKHRGRGYVQLTWKNNYILLGKLLGIDLENRPDLALVPENAYNILVLGMTQGLFTGRKLADYLLLPPAAPNYKGARWVVNGQDKADEIAKLAQQLEDCFTASLVV